MPDSVDEMSISSLSDNTTADVDDDVCPTFTEAGVVVVDEDGIETDSETVVVTGLVLQCP